MIIRRGKTDRHRQQALAEHKNLILGRELFKIMNLQEIKTGRTNREWVKHLPNLIQKVNANLPKPISKPVSEDPIVTASSQEILPIGTEVRVKLEAPIDIVSGKKLHGTFRASDIRYEMKPRTITNFIIKDGYPILYNVDDKFIGYTRNQIKPVEDESFDAEKIKQKQVEKIQQQLAPRTSSRVRQSVDYKAEKIIS